MSLMLKESVMLADYHPFASPHIARLVVSPLGRTLAIWRDPLTISSFMLKNNGLSLSYPTQFPYTFICLAPEMMQMRAIHVHLGLASNNACTDHRLYIRFLVAVAKSGQIR